MLTTSIGWCVFLKIESPPQLSKGLCSGTMQATDKTNLSFHESMMIFLCLAARHLKLSPPILCCKHLNFCIPSYQLLCKGLV